MFLAGLSLNPLDYECYGHSGRKFDIGRKRIMLTYSAEFVLLWTKIWSFTVCIPESPRGLVKTNFNKNLEQCV